MIDFSAPPFPSGARPAGISGTFNSGFGRESSRPEQPNVANNIAQTMHLTG